MKNPWPLGLRSVLHLFESQERVLNCVEVSRFCPGSFTEEQALKAAVATWPPGVRPVVHWSESQEGRKAHAHSDFVDVRHIDSRDVGVSLVLALPDLHSGQWMPIATQMTARQGMLTCQLGCFVLLHGDILSHVHMEEFGILQQGWVDCLKTRLCRAP